MTKQVGGALLSIISLDRRGKIPLCTQLIENMRKVVMDGRLRPGDRLPSSRVLARELLVSRTTIVDAFEQLIAEGYLEAFSGDGTYVTKSLPAHLREFNPKRKRKSSDLSSRRPNMSVRGRALINTSIRSLYSPPIPFSPNIPAFDRFPVALWTKLNSRCIREISPEELYYGDPSGLFELRRAIAKYLAVARGVNCEPEQVIVTNGAQYALTLCALLLTDPGDAVWVEDPSSSKPRIAFECQQTRIISVPVDSEGFMFERAMEMAPDARLCLLTPSRHSPLGMTLSLARRIELLTWARQNQAWIVEDDYDSEFRYVNRPLPAMQGLDNDGRVIYVGTFSKVLFPSLRLAYLVVPPNLITPTRKAVNYTARSSTVVQQAVLARFIEDGHFTTHIRQMRQLYAERKDALVAEIHKQLGGLASTHGTETGMNLIVNIPDGSLDRDIYDASRKIGLIAYPLSVHYTDETPQNGLILGFSHVRSEIMPEYVAKLGQVLESLSKGKRTEH